MALARFTTGTILATRLADDGYAVADVVDGNGAIAFDVRYLHQGGGRANLQFCPSGPSPEGSPEVDELERIGAHVLIASTSAGSVILGGLDSPQIRDTRFAEGTTKEKALEIAQGENYPAAVSIADQLFHQDGSQIVIGKTAGVTLDTVGSEEACPVRVQVAANSHLRIAQAGNATDHVVLASSLFAKLTELEAKLDEVIERVNGNYNVVNTLVCAGAQPGLPVTPVTSAVNLVPGAPPLPPLTSWLKGDAEEYQASAIRISEQTVGDE